MPSFAREVFRFGPALVIPVMLVVSVAYSPWQHRDSWAAYVILLGMPVTALWHLALIVMERPRAKYILYALGNLSFYVLIGFYCLFWVTGDTI